MSPTPRRLLSTRRSLFQGRTSIRAPVACSCCAEECKSHRCESWARESPKLHRDRYPWRDGWPSKRPYFSPMSFLYSDSVRMVTPSSLALSYLEPGAAPPTTYLGFLVSEALVLPPCCWTSLTI